MVNILHLHTHTNNETRRVARPAGFFLLMGLVFVIIAAHFFSEYAPPRDYWIWAGVTVKDAPVEGGLYIYQGEIRTGGGRSTYERIGLYPYPTGSRRLYLVYRLSGDLPDAKAAASLFKKSAAAWERHGAQVIGLQLDFDSPTSGLLQYSGFLARVREALPREKKLGITGLGDWALYGNRQALFRIAENTDEIVFQLYQGRSHLPDIERYVNQLDNLRIPFRIGLIKDQDGEKYVERLKGSEYFNGTVYFILK